MKGHLEYLSLAQATGIEHHKKRYDATYNKLIGFLFGLSAGFSAAWIVISYINR